MTLTGRLAVLVPAAIAVAVLAGAGCGDDDDQGATPSLGVRLLPASEVSGYKVRDEFSWPELRPALRDGITYVDRGAATEVFERAGFEAAAARVLTKGKQDDAWMIVFELGSEDGAAAARDFVHSQDLEQCPGECLFSLVEFDVEGVPEAVGASALPTGQAKGGQKVETYTIEFVAGNHMYLVQRYALPGGTGPEDVTELARLWRAHLEELDG